MEIKELVKKQRDYFFCNETKSYEFRKKALKDLLACINNHEAEIVKSLYDDLNKSDIEAYMTEIGLVKGEIKYALKHLSTWMKRKRVKTSLSQIPGKCYVVKDPYGVVLIMSPWNYPFLLSIAPLVGAIASGNCCILKPSIYSLNTSHIIKKIINSCFKEEYCAVIEGGRNENTELLNQVFDYIFFTGSGAVGKIVMEKASVNLTPISLELGGKSPVIIDETADIDLTAKRLIFGKFINAGQTCIAPDYVLVHKSKENELLECIKKWINTFYKLENNKIEDYPKIINEKHFNRLLGLIDSKKVYYGGTFNKENLTIFPTIMTNVEYSDLVMQEEIFGPILPVLTYTNLDEVIKKMHDLPKPLALYLFTNDSKVKNRILQQVSFGGGCINDTLMHIATTYMGFGGVGYSGMGSYHGASSFDTFTHKKSIIEKGKYDLPIRFRPYGKKAKEIIKKI